METMLQNRFDQELQNNGNLSPNQYGVNQYEDSTLDALSKLKEIAQKTKFSEAGDRWFLLTVDVNNAWNFASWNKIFSRLQMKNSSGYLIATIMTTQKHHSVRWHWVHTNIASYRVP